MAQSATITAGLLRGHQSDIAGDLLAAVKAFRSSGGTRYDGVKLTFHVFGCRHYMSNCVVSGVRFSSFRIVDDSSSDRSIRSLRVVLRVVDKYVTSVNVENVF
jgi:hypothetical protein